MARPTLEQLQAQIAHLQQEIDRLTGRRPLRASAQKQTDYVEHGSAEHAALLGLRKATDEDELVLDGWTLEDITSWPATATEAWLKRVLRQKINSLTYPLPEMQSEDPRKANYAPPMWDPRPQG